MSADNKRGNARGMYKSRTYKSWEHMKQRCTNPRHHRYDLYGGRGITVCERWHQFENFLADMGERPEGRSIDRYPNNNGNYEPGNCRWPTPSEQQKNRRAFKRRQRTRTTGWKQLNRKRLTHCKRGHPLTPDNIYKRTTRKGHEGHQCRTCSIDRARVNRIKNCERYRERRNERARVLYRLRREAAASGSPKPSEPA